MKKLSLLVLVMLLWLVGCAAYKSIEVEYPTSSYIKYRELKVEIVTKDVNKEELKNELKDFEALVVSALQKRGVAVVNDGEKPILTLEVKRFYKDSQTKRIVSTAVMWLLVPGPNRALYTKNEIELRAAIRDKERTIELKEFQEFKESTKDWDDLKKTVASRIGDAVYFTR